MNPSLPVPPTPGRPAAPRPSVAAATTLLDPAGDPRMIPARLRRLAADRGLRLAAALAAAAFAGTMLFGVDAAALGRVGADTVAVVVGLTTVGHGLRFPE